MPPDAKIPNNLEIDRALKEFEMKSNAERLQETSGVSKIPDNSGINQALQEFEEKSSREEQQKIPKALQTSEIPKMVQLVMKWSGGAIQEQKQAEYVLLGFVVLAITISLFLFFGGNEPEKLPPEELFNNALTMTMNS